MGAGQGADEAAVPAEASGSIPTCDELWTSLGMYIGTRQEDWKIEVFVMNRFSQLSLVLRSTTFRRLPLVHSPEEASSLSVRILSSLVIILGAEHRLCSHAYELSGRVRRGRSIEHNTYLPSLTWIP